MTISPDGEACPYIYSAGWASREYVASLLGVQVPGPWDELSGDLGPEASEQV